MIRFLLLVCAAVTLTLAAPVPVGQCVSDCTGVADGDYQSCNGCNVYATCSNGLISDNRPCASNLVWDDQVKKCEYTSPTCGATGAPPPACQITNCVSSCAGTADGDYQSCNGCNVYVTCSNQLIYDDRPCPAGLVWDDQIKRCEWTSTTCNCGGSGGSGGGSGGGGGGGTGGGTGGSGTCVSDCKGVSNGDYQSCNGCNVYVTCSNELIYDNRPCPAGLVWDDNIKRCEYTSTTCSSGTVAPAPCQVTNCVSDCSGKADGDYQSCNGCNVYVTCSNQLIYDDRPCPAGLVWDDQVKRCEWTSTTCNCGGSGGGGGGSGNGSGGGTGGGTGGSGNCVSDCKGVSNGDYQSCNGCNVYVTCSNELIYDNRPCPAGLVWDDNIKRCEYTSATCTSGTVPPASCQVTSCVSSCAGKADGDYQSCNGCNVYVTCSNQLIYDDRPCPAGLVWDDQVKRCEWTSTTCNCGGGGGGSGGTGGGNGGGTGGGNGGSGNCVSDCKGMSDGDYQSCNGCNVYVTCSNELIYDNRPCPAGLVWDDNIKRCEYTSTTCSSGGSSSSCVSDCTGRQDGDYQSCLGCTVYATCSNEILTDNRPCAANLVWDDAIKRCEYTSATCP